MIETRDGAGGKKFRYLTAQGANELLDLAFYDKWKIEINTTDKIVETEKDKIRYIFIATGKLYILDEQGNIIAEASQCGTGIAYDFHGIDTAAKGAITDMKKKCMSELGFINELYPNHVNAPTKWYTDDLNKQIKEEIMKFLSSKGLKDSGDMAELLSTYSIETFGYPAIYYTAEHFRYMHIDYLLDYKRWLKERIE